MPPRNIKDQKIKALTLYWAKLHKALYQISRQVSAFVHLFGPEAYFYIWDFSKTDIFHPVWCAFELNVLFHYSSSLTPDLLDGSLSSVGSSSGSPAKMEGVSPSSSNSPFTPVQDLSPK